MYYALQTAKYISLKGLTFKRKNSLSSCSLMLKLPFSYKMMVIVCTFFFFFYHFTWQKFEISSHVLAFPNPESFLELLQGNVGPGVEEKVVAEACLLPPSFHPIPSAPVILLFYICSMELHVEEKQTGKSDVHPRMASPPGTLCSASFICLPNLLGYLLPSCEFSLRPGPQHRARQ